MKKYVFTILFTACAIFASVCHAQQHVELRRIVSQSQCVTENGLRYVIEPDSVHTWRIFVNSEANNNLASYVIHRYSDSICVIPSGNVCIVIQYLNSGWNPPNKILGVRSVVEVGNERDDFMYTIGIRITVVNRFGVLDSGNSKAVVEITKSRDGYAYKTTVNDRLKTRSSSGEIKTFSEISQWLNGHPQIFTARMSGGVLVVSSLYVAVQGVFVTYDGVMQTYLSQNTDPELDDVFRHFGNVKGSVSRVRDGYACIFNNQANNGSWFKFSTMLCK